MHANTHLSRQHPDLIGDAVLAEDVLNGMQGHSCEGSMCTR